MPPKVMATTNSSPLSDVPGNDALDRMREDVESQGDGVDRGNIDEYGEANGASNVTSGTTEANRGRQVNFEDDEADDGAEGEAESDVAVGSDLAGGTRRGGSTRQNDQTRQPVAQSGAGSGDPRRGRGAADGATWGTETTAASKRSPRATKRPARYADGAEPPTKPPPKKKAKSAGKRREENERDDEGDDGRSASRKHLQDAITDLIQHTVHVATQYTDYTRDHDDPGAADGAGEAFYDGFDNAAGKFKVFKGMKKRKETKAGGSAPKKAKKGNK